MHLSVGTHPGGTASPLLYRIRLSSLLNGRPSSSQKSLMRVHGQQKQTIFVCLGVVWTMRTEVVAAAVERRASRPQRGEHNPAQFVLAAARLVERGLGSFARQFCLETHEFRSKPYLLQTSLGGARV